MKELVEYLVKSLVDQPGDVLLEEREEEDTVVLDRKSVV